MAQPPNFTDMPPVEPSEALAGDAVALPATLPSAATTGPVLRNGARVGRYIILKPLGEGGMGVVYAAYDPELDRKVALKLLREEVTAGGSGDGRDRLVREAHAMAKLNHPNVVTIYDSGIYGEQVFLAVELVAGSDLWTWLTEPHGWREVLEIFLKAGRGLVAAHAAGLLHRDFKPENVLLGKEGEVKVADFGLARSASLTATRSASSVQLPVASPETLFRPLTRAGLVSGTPGFIAPEQLAGSLGDARSDEFSFCVALYQALYRERPFAQQVGPRGEQLVAEAPKGTQVPSWLRKVVVRGLAMKPEDRYPSMSALLEALEADPTRPRRRVLSAIGVVALVIAGSAATGLVIWRQRLAGDPCRSNGQPLAGVWDDAVRQRLAMAFQAFPGSSPESSGGTRWKEAAKALDYVANRWLVAQAGVCADSRSGRQTEAVVRLRLNCLDVQRDRLLEMTQAFRAPTPDMVAAASVVIQTLDYPSDCTDGDPRVLSVVERPPPLEAAAVAKLQTRLIQGTALRFNGKPAAAVTQLQAVLADARAAGAGRLEARVLAEIAFIQGDQQLVKESVANLEEALRVAELQHLDLLAAFIGAQLIGNLASWTEGQGDLPAAVARGRQLVARAGDVPSARADLEYDLGTVALVRGWPNDGAAHFQEALRLIRQVGGPDESLQEEYLMGLINALVNGGRDAEGIVAAEENIALARRLDGEHGFQIPWCEYALAVAFRHLGRLSEARGAAQRGVGDGTESSGAESLAALAEVDTSEGKLSAAVAEVGQALEILDKLQLRVSLVALDVLYRAASVLLEAGQIDRARQLRGEVLALAKTFLDPDARDWVIYLNAAGAIDLASGQAELARGELERALALSQGHRFYPGCLAQLRYLLARALIETHGDKARAEQLATQADIELSALPAQKRLYGQLVAWRSHAFGPSLPSGR